MSTEVVNGEGFRIDGQIVTHVTSGSWFQIGKGDNAHVHSRHLKKVDRPAEIEAMALEAWKMHLEGEKKFID